VTFRSAEGIRLWHGLRKVLLEYWHAINRLDFASAVTYVAAARTQAKVRQKRALKRDTCSDQVLDDYFLFVTALDALHVYAAYWDSVMEGMYSQSWSLLQDLQDSLRLIKRFGRRPDIHVWMVLEEQCAGLERLYPNRPYLSAEMIHGPVVCSVCGRRMDDPRCSHIPGNLYRGRLAFGVVQEILSAPALAFVTNPMDKRCGVVLPDDDEHFVGPGVLRRALRDGRLGPLRFAGVETDSDRAGAAGPDGNRSEEVTDRNGRTGSGLRSDSPDEREDAERLTVVCSDTPILAVEDLLRLRRVRRTIA
jgi:hypothetical protein